ncbi:phosphoglycerate dehydrogenase [Paraeggerthella hongkongensis]|uniref:phosphoglycerate dehydrogenase n=1 Tax=Paraeggerthella TaxID=651554 RepID=UPI000DF72AFA|nr:MULTISPECIES: phosphoglycerate dehydrogenase [Paraeggerthella]MBU5405050.1 phosphoglycerate dehydrogenase [Paraeggerthella hongkongensis]MCD2432859.1 phosphoglycerate dehydrogenase [Paraeggerthella hominis]RDB55146.1 3-phosphoglycerate dehydrogenase [Paraeggerthella hongkongensis]
MRHIHCLNNISAYGTDLLTDDYALTDDLSQAAGVLVRSAAMHDMEFPQELLAIARAGAGVNNIPLDRCAEEGIVVFNTPGANANAVKELVLCGMLLGSRGVVDGIAWCRDNADDPNIGKAAEKAKKAFAGREIQGKKLGVIGLGAIGALVANAAIDLGMDVYGYDPYVSVGAAWRLSSSVRHVTNLDDLLRECDYITIHVPAIEGTIGMIDERACSLMKDGAVFLNFSRDTLVNDEAMAAALAAGKVGAYVTDFANPAVMKMERAIVLPHLGASTAEAEDNCAVMAVRQTMDYLENGNIVNSVNYPACDMGPCPAEGGRVAVLHANVPNMISQITNVFGDAGVNIDNLTNKARGEAAYTLLDLNAAAPDAAVEKLAAIEGVRRVRVVK